MTIRPILRYAKKRLCERSTYAHLVTCLTAVAAVAFGLPHHYLLGLVALSLIGALVPDGRVAADKEGPCATGS